MKKCSILLAMVLTIRGLTACIGVEPIALAGQPPPAVIAWPAGLPRYDHVLIVIEENKDYDQIIGQPQAEYINTLRKEGANFTRMFGEEHNSEGNYFWLFSGSNHNVGFIDQIPSHQFTTPNLGQSLIAKGLSFKGYAEGLPAISSMTKHQGLYARKHVPWVSFDNIPHGNKAATSSNLRYPEDFPTNFSDLPTVSIVVPNLVNDMHNGELQESIPAGDRWLQKNLRPYYEWAKTNNSLLIVTFDENDTHRTNYRGLTDPFAPGDKLADKVKRNQIVTIFAGAHIKPGDYAEGKGITHVNILRTLEAMYGLPKSGAQQVHAAAGGIGDDTIVTDVFENVPR